MMAAINHPQLPLGLEPGELFTFANFVTDKNSVAVGLAQRTAVGTGEQQLYFWGEPGLGKSHLLQACCNLAARHNRTVCYLTQAEIAGRSAEMFDGLEQLELICLDDIESWLIDETWERALFDLINRVREKSHSLIMSSAFPPDAASVKLPDLRSRMAWGPVFQLHGLSDSGKLQALRYRAKQSGLELPENVAEYLMQRYPRDMFGLLEKLSVLDRASMVMQRRLTIPLIKTVLADE